MILQFYVPIKMRTQTFRLLIWLFSCIRRNDCYSFPMFLHKVSGDMKIIIFNTEFWSLLRMTSMLHCDLCPLHIYSWQPHGILSLLRYLEWQKCEYKWIGRRRGDREKRIYQFHIQASGRMAAKWQFRAVKVSWGHKGKQAPVISWLEQECSLDLQFEVGNENIGVQAVGSCILFAARTHACLA